jgi:hypothetical protein
MRAMLATLRTLGRCYLVARAYESGEMSLAEVHTAMTAPEAAARTGESASAAHTAPSLAA